MKKQIFVIGALLIALFFTACEQETLINPLEDNTVLLENDVQPPQEAVDALEILIASDFAENETEARCNTQSDARGIIGYVPLSSTGGGSGTGCSLIIRPKGYKTSGNTALFYFHVDQKATPGSNYKLVSSGFKWTSNFTWNLPTFPGVPQSNGNEYCAYRTYVYVWDGPCETWHRLKVRYSTHGG